MKRIKRFITFMLAIMLMLTAVPAQAKDSLQSELTVQERQYDRYGIDCENELLYPTAELPEMEKHETEEITPSVYTAGDYESEIDLFLQLEPLVKEALLAGQTRINIREYGINSDEYQLYSKAPNRKGHVPYVFKALITDDPKKLGEDIVCQDGKN